MTFNATLIQASLLTDSLKDYEKISLVNTLIGVPRQGFSLGINAESANYILKDYWPSVSPLHSPSA